MARPTKQGLEYFSFDTDFFDNAKIRLIEAEVGHKGISILIRLLCQVYKENGYFYEWTARRRLLFSASVGFPCGQDNKRSLVDEVIDSSLRWDFFDYTAYCGYNILISAEIQTRYSEAVVRRQKIKIVKEYWLLDDQPSCTIEWTNCAAKSDRNTIPKTEQSKIINDNINTFNVCNNSYTEIISENEQNEPIINVCNNSINDNINPQSKSKSNITTTTTQNLKNYDHSLFLNNHIIKNHSRLYLEFSDLLNNDWHERLMTKYEKEDLIEALSQMNNKMQSGKYFCLGTTIETWTNTIVKRKQKDQFKGNPNEQNNAKSGSSSTRRSNSRNDGQSSTVKYPSCSDGRHPGDFAPEEYARAKAAAKAKRDRETAGNVPGLQIQ